MVDIPRRRPPQLRAQRQLASAPIVAELAWGTGGGPGGCFQESAENLPWQDLVPDQSLIASDAGSGATLVLAARGSRGDWAAVYVPEPGAVTVRIPKSLSARGYAAAWIDPRTGRTAEGSGAHGGRDAHDATFSGTVPPGLEDALLVLR